MLFKKNSPAVDPYARHRQRYGVLESVNIIGVTQSRIGLAFWNAWNYTATATSYGCIAPLFSPVEYRSWNLPSIAWLSEFKKCQIL
jgi:hypothetical protein